jgi:hypothetical protein
MKGDQATRQELEKIGRELVERGRIIEYLRLLVRDQAGKEMAPLEPSD